MREGIRVSINDNLKIDMQLMLGQSAETVEVTADVAAVQAESSSPGSVISRETVDMQPLKGHSSLFLYMDAPGVVGNRYLEDTRPTDTGTNAFRTRSTE